MRGNVAGWYPTVPRGELTALIMYLQHAGPDEAYIGDCAYVIDGARGGVPRKLTSSTSPNADLWREVKRRMEDREQMSVICKTRAHRSQREAQEDTTEPIRWWHGNRAADWQAKELARKIAEVDTRMYEAEAARTCHQNAIARVALGAAWAYRHWPAKGDPGEGKRGSIPADDAEDEGDRHVLYRDDGGRLERRVCRKYANAKRAMARMFVEKCSGDIMRQIHPSHNVRSTAGIVWCTCCGAYTTRQPRLLAKECNRRPTTIAQKNVLRRLTANLPPTTAAYLGNVAVANGGVAGANNGHADEVLWRRSAAGDVGPGNGGDARPPGTSRLACAPTGRYARLPGGRLHRDPDGDDRPRGDDALHDDMRGDFMTVEFTMAATTPENAQARWQPRGAEAQAAGASAIGTCTGAAALRHPPLPSACGNDTLQDAQRTSREDICTPTANSAWTRRLHTRYTVCAKACGICSTPTRTLCRGCERPLCMRCARGRDSCSAVT